jgi:hypothetical protein
MKPALSIICCIYFQLAVSNAQESFQLIKYSPPFNWVFAENQGAKQYLFNDSLNNNYCVITIYGAANSSGTQESDFLEEWETKVLSIATVFGKPKMQQLKTVSGFTYIKGGKQVSMKNGGDNFFVDLLVFRTRDTRQSILIGSATEKTLASYKDILSDFVASIRKNNITTTEGARNQQASPQTTMDVTPSNTAPVSNNGVLYCGMQAATEGFNYGNSIRYLYLGPGNNFRWGYSQEGYYNYQPETDKARTPDFAGTFTKTTNKITLNFYSARKMELIINKNNDLQALSGGYQLFKLPQLTNHISEQNGEGGEYHVIVKPSMKE